MPPDPSPPPDTIAEILHVTIAEAASGERLDRALAAALPSLSRTRLQALIAAGRVAIGGRTVEDASARVKPGQTAEIALPPAAPAAPEPQAIALSILYEDDQLLVVDKPAGLVVHPAPGNPDRTLVNALLAHAGASLSGIGGVARPGIVHRLDKDTSGLMVVAKTDPAHRALSAQFADRTLSRTYLAVVHGRPRPAEGTIDRPIGRDPRDRKRMAVVSRGGKPAITRYRVLAPLGEAASLVECRLATGRTHQIRVHLAALGHPIVGDPGYGRRPRAGLPEAARAFPRQALHAAALHFMHPLYKREVQFTSPLPGDMRQLMASLVPGGDIPEYLRRVLSGDGKEAEAAQPP